MGKLLEKVRRWIDGEDNERRLEELIETEKPDSPAMKFIVRIVDAIKNDMVTGGSYTPSTENAPAYFPSAYNVYISESDSRRWTGDRLSDLRTKVAEGVMRKVADLDRTGTTQTIRIDVRTDGTLNPGQIRVQGLSETSPTKTSAELPTAPDTTTVLPTLYSIEVFDGNRFLATHSIVYTEIYIGRHKNAHIRLEGDNRIGREHACLILEDGKLTLCALHENPIQVGANILTKRDKRTLTEGESFTIYDFKLIPRL